MFDELMATGAVIAGRRTFDLAGGWAGDRPDGVPIFVLTHAAPDEPAPGSAHSVTDHIELELLRALDGPGVLHLRYHVQSAGG